MCSSRIPPAENPVSMYDLIDFKHFTKTAKTDKILARKTGPGFLLMFQDVILGGKSYDTKKEY